MLLYIDRKKQKQKRTKKAVLTITAILFITLNCLHFSTALHQTNKTLLTYRPHSSSSEEYERAMPVTIFTAAPDSAPTVILISPVANRQDFTTIAWAFSQIAPNTTEIYFTPEIKDTTTLLSLIKIFAPACHIAANIPDTTQSASVSPATFPVIISSDITAVNSAVSEQKLYPHTLNYAAAIKSGFKSSLAFISTKPLLDSLFPRPKKPTERLAVEQNALRDFAREHKEELISAFSPQAFPFKFSTNHLLLQNVPLCLTTSQKSVCSFAINVSLQKNLKTALRKLPADQIPSRLSLLTSAIETTPQTALLPDEGLIFRFGSRETLLLPKEIANLRQKLITHSRQATQTVAKDDEIFRFLQLKSGLNPDYHNAQMKFYKFKTVEVNLNDNI